MKKADPWRLWFALLLSMGTTLCLLAEAPRKVTLHLKNADRLTGEVLSEDGERIVLSTHWNTAIYVPKSEIVQVVAIVPAPARKEADAGAAERPTVEAAGEQPPALPPLSRTTDAARPVAAAGTKPTQASPPATRKAKHWKWSLKLGTDLVKGAKDRSVYFGQTALTSAPESLDVISGRKLWEQVFGLPNSQQPDGSPEVRKYLLQQANYVRSQIRLYARVTDVAEERTFGVVPIGPMVSFSRPTALVDGDSNLHVLYQSGPRVATYCKLDPDGEILMYEKREFSASKPRLSAADDGEISVIGGTPLRLRPDAAAPPASVQQGDEES